MANTEDVEYFTYYRERFDSHVSEFWIWASTSQILKAYPPTAKEKWFNGRDFILSGVFATIAIITLVIRN